ncbi:hybrid sensor histidine kinase/response regulator transcription factor [Desertivirga xinjiangensis]|uniref:hybrid sensor histidine kinase/response regulator transcription factor n=1 Tax=Desertivirga xinjiangensis TaxID=539206 RepID=UPI00210C6290|nr:hybrid sensor histidine kinase/response regulator transcription factor [Pedobacter xinjiangensis]
MKTFLPIAFFLLIQLSISPVKASAAFDDVNRSINSHVNKLYQDKKGYIWICTDNGLSRFDGAGIKTFYHVYGDSTSLKSNAVLSVLEDSKGHFWVGTTGGLQLLDRNTEKFKNIHFSYPHITDFSYISCILEDRKGNIWVSTGKAGAIRLQAKTLRPTYYLPTNSNICSNIINYIFEDRYGNIWLGSQDRGVSVINVDNNIIVNYRYEPGNKKSLSSSKIFSIAETPGGDVLIGSIDSGIDLFDYSSRTIKRNYIPRSYLVYTMMTDRNNNLWIGTDGDGVKQYNFETRQTTTYEHFVQNINLANAKVHSVIEDKQGNIWMGLYQRGVVMIPPSGKTSGFQIIGSNTFYGKKSISLDCVLSILEDQDQHLWIGTDGDGIYRFDKNKDLYRHYHLGRSHGKSALSIVQDSKGRIWTGTYLSGLYLYDPQTDTFAPEPLLCNGDKVTDINTIAEADDKTLWIGTNNNGVCIYHPDTKKTRWLQHDIKRTGEQLLSNSIHSILHDAAGNVWIGTSTAGLSCYNKPTGSFTNYTAANGKISNPSITQVVSGHNGNLWVGTKTGLNYLDLQKGTTTIFTEADGLRSASISAIESDHQNNIWISTMSGLSRLNTSTKKITNFEITDGLTMKGEFRRNASFRSAQGELFFGGTGGLVHFKPFKDIASHPVLGLYLTDLYIYSKRVEPGSSNDSPIRQSADVSTEVNFGHQIKNFSFGFAAIEFNQPGKVIYQTKMEGFEDEWKTVRTGNRLATFTNLSPGRYLFKVRAFLEGTRPVERTIAIVIHPPLLLTWWAKTLYTAIFIALLCLIYRAIKHGQHKKKEDALKEGEARMMQSKLQFFTDISHEIRTPLTLILAPLEELLKNENNPSLSKVYQLINQNAHRILRLIDQTRDVKRIDQGKVSLCTENTELNQFIESIARSFDYISREKNIELILDTDKNISLLWIDKDILDKVLVNLLSNAFKYTDSGGVISVKTEVQNKTINICVTDTGIGIPVRYRKLVFERFYRVPNDDNKAIAGTGIGLHISRSLMELHYGTIFIKDTPSRQGTAVVIQIPANDLRLKPVPKQDEVATGTNRSASGRPASGKHPGRFTLLIVEDDKSIRSYLSSILEKEYSIIEACDGIEGLEKAIRYVPDCIVSDLMMPRLDGLELCKKIKSHDRTRHIPVIILTAKGTLADRIEGLQVGADSYIPKPFNTDHLKTRISKLIELRSIISEKLKDDANGRSEKPALKSIDDVFLEKLELIVRKRIDDPELSVDVISSEIGVSRSHLQRKMKQLTRQNPSEYIKTMRLKHAAWLLSSNKLTVSEVSYATGFTTLSHFSNSFKEQYGMSPTRYLEIHAAHCQL